MEPRTNLGRSVDITLYIDGLPLGGQQSANLSRQSRLIDITNKINSEWEEVLGGTKSWSVVCSGIYVINDEALALLEDAFMNNKSITVSLNTGFQRLQGQALITDFPLSAVFDKEFKYTLNLLGTGPLERV